MTTIKKTVTVAIAALALTTASFAISVRLSPAVMATAVMAITVVTVTDFGHGHFGHGHFGHRFYAYNSCWKWSPYGPINVCYRSY